MPINSSDCVKKFFENGEKIAKNIIAVHQTMRKIFLRAEISIGMVIVILKNCPYLVKSAKIIHKNSIKIPKIRDKKRCNFFWKKWVICEEFFKKYAKNIPATNSSKWPKTLSRYGVVWGLSNGILYPKNCTK